jgi:hypothetical protein
VIRQGKTLEGQLSAPRLLSTPSLRPSLHFVPAPNSAAGILRKRGGEALLFGDLVGTLLGHTEEFGDLDEAEDSLRAHELTVRFAASYTLLCATPGEETKGQRVTRDGGDTEPVDHLIHEACRFWSGALHLPRTQLIQHGLVSVRRPLRHSDVRDERDYRSREVIRWIVVRITQPVPG